MQVEAGYLEKDAALGGRRPDDELVIQARSGDDFSLQCLLSKYENFVRIKARSYFLIGAEKDDLIQEGMIGLFKAVRDFRAEKQASFRAFAELCVTRQMITAIKTATRQKHIPLNSYVSLNKPLHYEEEDRTLMDTLASGGRDPLELIVGNEEFKNIKSSFKELLSDLEERVLKLYVDGRSYQEIAGELDRDVKSIDNALQRVKRKLGLHFGDKYTV